MSSLACGGWAVYPIALSFAGDWGKAVMSQDNNDAKAFIADLVARSRAAQKQIEHYSQEQVDALIRAMVWSVARPGMAEEIAQFTIDEPSSATTTANS